MTPRVPDEERSRKVLLGLHAVLAVAVASRFVSAFVRNFNHDEFQIWYTAWLKSVGKAPGRDFYLSSYIPLSDALAPIFRLAPGTEIPIWVSRILVAAAGAVSALLVLRLGRRLGGPLAGAIAGLYVVFQPDLVERVGDVRPDAFNILFLLVAFECVLARPGRFRAAAAGAAMSLAVISRFKMAVALPPLLLLAALMWRRRVKTLSLPFGLGIATPLVLYSLQIVLFDDWRLFVQTAVHVAHVVTDPGFSFSPLPTVLASAARAPFGWSIVAASVSAIGVAVVFRRTATWRHPAAAAAAAGCAITLIAANPAFYPYNFIEVIPLLGLLIAAAQRLFRFRRRWSYALLVAVLGVGFVAEGAGMTIWSLQRTNGLQLRYLAWLRSALGQEETVFDLQGTHLYRPGIYHWRLSSAQIPLYATGRWFSIPEELARFRVSLIVINYRFGFLSRSDRVFILRHYVQTGPFFFEPGFRFRAGRPGTTPIEVLVPGTYMFVPSRPEGVLVDGVPPGDNLRLEVGTHTVHLGAPAGAEFALVFTTPLRRAARLEVPPGEKLLYLFGETPPPSP